MFLHEYRLYNKKRPYDLIDIDCIERIDFWVVEDEMQSELDFNNLEEMFHNEQAIQTPNELRVGVSYIISMDTNNFLDFIN